jgi:hypothetical protein
MSNASEFQESLERLGTDIGAETLALYEESFGSDWPDEEATTGALLGAVALSAKQHAERMRLQGAGGITLKAGLTQKHREKEHGGDALIRFSCQEAEWSISSTTMIQAKRHDRNHPFNTADYQRLTGQLVKMMRYTPESFVMLYSRREGIQLVHALAARSLGSRDLFDLQPLPWARFLSGIFLGHFGEPVPDRAPDAAEGWKPMWVLEITASMTREVPRMASLRAG